MFSPYGGGEGADNPNSSSFDEELVFPFDGCGC